MLENISIVLTILGGLLSGALIVVKYHASQQAKLQKLKDNQIQQQLRSFSLTLDGFKDAMEKLELIVKNTDDKFDVMSNTMIEVQTLMKGRTGDIGNLIKSMREFTADVSKRIKTMEHAMDDGELIKIGKDRWMFKGRRRETD